MSTYAIHAWFLGQPFTEKQKTKIASIFEKRWAPAVFFVEENGDSFFRGISGSSEYPQKIVDQIAKQIMRVLGGQDPMVWMRVDRLDEHPRDKFFYRRGKLMTSIMS